MTDNRTTELINDRVSRLLHEAGIDFTVRSLMRTGSMESYDKFTVFDSDKMLKAQIETSFHNSETVLLTLRCTPEQAIAATLGSGTCCLHYGEDDDGYDGWYCDECGGWFLAVWRNGHLVKPKHCQECGRKVVSA